MTTSDEIRLKLPAQAEYGRVARIAAAQLALRIGFSLHEIDDLRLVMDEASVMLLGADRVDGSVAIDYSAGENAITIVMRHESDATAPLPIERIDRFRELVGELVDTYAVDAAERRLTISKARSRND